MQAVKNILLWLALAFACFRPAFALTPSAPENPIWEIFSIGYDAPTAEAIIEKGGQASYRSKTMTENMPVPFSAQVEFLELGILNGTRQWKVYGPDRDGIYGGQQGCGGLDGYIDETSGTVYGSINNFFGDSIGQTTSSGGGGFGEPLGGYGVLPGSGLPDMAPIWRGHYLDWTQFYCMGARYYDPLSGRFLSTDPAGYDGSMSLYDYCHGDPVNDYDPDGRCFESVYNGGPLETGLRDAGDYLENAASNASNSTFAFGESYVGGLFNEFGGVNLHSIVNTAGQFGSNVYSEDQQYGLLTSAEYAATSWNLGAIESAAFNINPITAQPIGSGLDRLELGLQGVAGTTAVVAPVDAAFTSLTAAEGLPQGPLLNPADINFSQRSVSANVENYTADMSTPGGWNWAQSGPLRVMDQDGQWVSYDNRRLMAAQNANLDSVPVQIVDPAAIMPGSKMTWGEAFAARQNHPWNVQAGGAVPTGGLSTQPTIFVKPGG